MATTLRRRRDEPQLSRRRICKLPRPRYRLLQPGRARTCTIRPGHAHGQTGLWSISNGAPRWRKYGNGHVKIRANDRGNDVASICARSSCPPSRISNAHTSSADATTWLSSTLDAAEFGDARSQIRAAGRRKSKSDVRAWPTFLHATGLAGADSAGLELQNARICQQQRILQPIELSRH